MRKLYKYIIISILLSMAVWCIIAYQNAVPYYCLTDPWTDEVICTENLSLFNEWRGIYTGNR